MNATQRNFVISQAMDILYNKLTELKHRLAEENDKCEITPRLTAKEVHAAIKKGEVKLLPMSKLKSSYVYISDLYNLTPLVEAKCKLAIQAGYHLCNSSGVYLRNPLKPTNERWIPNSFNEVTEAGIKCNNHLKSLVTELMLGDNTVALQILNDLKEIKL